METKLVPFLSYSKLTQILVCVNQATGMQASIFGCLSQARINWEGCVRKGIWRKNGGDGRGGGTNQWMGWQSIRIVGASACVIFILHQKIQKMAKCTFWYWLTQVVPDKVQRAIKWLVVVARYLSKVADFNLIHRILYPQWGDPVRILLRSLACENESLGYCAALFA